MRQRIFAIQVILAYTGMALMRMLFEFTIAAYLVRHGKFDELKTVRY